MKVLFTTNYLSPYRVDFFNELGRYCDLTVFVEKKMEDQSHRSPEWFKKNFNYFTVNYLKPKKVFGKNIHFSINKFIKENHFDLIIMGGYSTPTQILAILLMKLNKLPFLVNLDGAIYSDKKRFKNFIKKLLFKCPSAFLVSGNYTLKYLENFGVPAEKVYIYPFTSLAKNDLLKNSVTLKEKEILREKLSISEKKVIISVGQFIYRKGFDVLLKACKNIDRNVGIYIIGGNPSDEYIKLKEDNNLLNVHFVGFKKKADILNYYRCADLMVLPTREDIWGLVINEAMAQGLPVITTDRCVAGLDLISNGENGYVVPVENEGILLQRINEILADDQLIQTMSQNNIKKIQDYTIEKMATRHMDIFKEFLENAQK